MELTTTTEEFSRGFLRECLNSGMSVKQAAEALVAKRLEEALENPAFRRGFERELGRVSPVLQAKAAAMAKAADGSSIWRTLDANLADKGSFLKDVGGFGLQGALGGAGLAAALLAGRGLFRGATYYPRLARALERGVSRAEFGAGKASLLKKLPKHLLYGTAGGGILGSGYGVHKYFSSPYSSWHNNIVNAPPVAPGSYGGGESSWNGGDNVPVSGGDPFDYGNGGSGRVRDVTGRRRRRNSGYGGGASHGRDGGTPFDALRQEENVLREKQRHLQELQAQRNLPLEKRKGTALGSVISGRGAGLDRQIDDLQKEIERGRENLETTRQVLLDRQAEIRNYNQDRMSEAERIIRRTNADARAMVDRESILGKFFHYINGSRDPRTLNADASDQGRRAYESSKYVAQNPYYGEVP